MVLGGAVGLAGDLGQQWINIYSLAVGLLLFMMEWARGARKQGRTMARMYQEKITPFLGKSVRASVQDCLVLLSLGCSCSPPRPAPPSHTFSSGVTNTGSVGPGLQQNLACYGATCSCVASCTLGTSGPFLSHAPPYAFLHTNVPHKLISAAKGVPPPPFGRPRAFRRDVSLRS